MEAPILATHDLGLDIGGARIVADVSLEVGEGELVGIIGPNGAGKTTLFNLLSGVVAPTAGRIELAGKDVTHAPPHRRTQAGLGRSFQVSSVFPLLAVQENVRLAAEANDRLSIAVIVTGSRVSLTRLRQAALGFPVDTSVLAVICDERAHPRMQPLAGLTVLTVGTLDDLSGLLLRGATT